MKNKTITIKKVHLNITKTIENKYYICTYIVENPGHILPFSQRINLYPDEESNMKEYDKSYQKLFEKVMMKYDWKRVVYTPYYPLNYEYLLKD